METDRDLYIAWLEVQMANDELEQEWLDNRRGKQNANSSRGLSEVQRATEEGVYGTDAEEEVTNRSMGGYPDAEGSDDTYS